MKKANLIQSKKRRYKIRINLLIIAILSAILISCAPPSKKEVELYWPLPPEEPRIKWVGWIRGEKDIKEMGAEERFLAALTGKEAGKIMLVKPYGTHARDGRIYVSDTAAGKVAVFDSREKESFYLGEKGRGVLKKPIGVTTDKESNIYVTDVIQNRAVVYNRDGKFTHALGQENQFERPGGIAVNDVLGRVYVVDIRGHHIQVFSKDGQFLFEFGKRGVEKGEFNFPTNIFVDAEGKVYVSDSMNFRVQIFDADGEFITTFGKAGDGLGMFSKPKGVAVDSEGHIYVVDAAFNNIQIFNPEGQLLLFFGEMGAGPGRFLLPAGMYIDEDDKIYVADQFNRRINIFQYMGEKYKKSQHTANNEQGATP